MLVLFFITSFLILLSTLGYGIIIGKFLKIQSPNLGLIGLLGLFLLSILSSYSHIIISHNYFHNIIILIIGLFIVINYLSKNYFDYKKILFIFILLFIALIISKTNEDFPYYHLPNSLQFAQQKLQFGLGNLNHGFKHISSIFMLMSLTYLPVFDYYLFNLINFLFLVFFIFFILFEIFSNSNQNSNISKILLSFIIILFLTKFSRIAEYGTDLAGQMLVAVYLYYVFELLFNYKLSKKKRVDYFKLSLILIIFSITTKFIYIIYSLILFLPFVVLKDKRKIINEFIHYKFLTIIILPILFFLFFNFASTGCVIYPVTSTCFYETFDWAVPENTISYLNLHYETWSKGGMGPNFKIQNPELYVQNFNWFPNWISVYFFNKVTDYILVTILIILVFVSFFIKEIFKIKKNQNKFNQKLFFYFYLFLILVFLTWFTNFPTLRYAGYIVVYILIITPIIFFLNKKIDFKKKINLKKLIILFAIGYSIFLSKNINRIHNELLISKDNHHNFENFPFYWIEKVDFEKIFISDHSMYFVKNNKKCWNVPSTCVRSTSSIDIIKKNNYVFYKIKK